MKIILLSVLSICFLNGSAYASSDALASAVSVAEVSTDTPVTGERAKAIVMAVNAELAKNYLTCVSSTGTWKTTAEMIKAITNFIAHSTVEVYVSSDQSQPVLSFKYNEGSTARALATITTSSDFKTILNAEAVREKLAVTSVNVGTLMNPVFENRTIATVEYAASCKK